MMATMASLMSHAIQLTPSYAKSSTPLQAVSRSMPLVQTRRQQCFRRENAGLGKEERCRVNPQSLSRGRGFKKDIALASASTADPEKKTEIPPASVSVVLLSGGVGKRMGANMPKQYLPLLGQPIALYSLYTFAGMEEVGEVVVVCDPSYRRLFEDAACVAGIDSRKLKFALPGKERQDSVFNGLQAIRTGGQLACIHDSARPLVTAAEVRAVIRDAWTHGAAVLGVPCKATIKTAGADSFVKQTLDRKTLWEMQTPQVIEPELLRRGFDLVNREGLEVTDDVSIVEHLKHKVFITQGEYTNLKVTTPEDLILAEAILLQQRQREKAQLAAAAAA